MQWASLQRAMTRIDYCARSALWTRTLEWWSPRISWMKRKHISKFTLLLLWCEIEQDNVNSRFIRITSFLLVQLLLLLFFNVFYRNKRACCAAPICDTVAALFQPRIHPSLKCQRNVRAGVFGTGIKLRVDAWYFRLHQSLKPDQPKIAVSNKT